jgi:hypothetical protein
MSGIAGVSFVLKLIGKISRWKWRLNLPPICPIQKCTHLAAHFSA